VSRRISFVSTLLTANGISITSVSVRVALVDSGARNGAVVRCPETSIAGSDNS